MLLASCSSSDLTQDKAAELINTKIKTEAIHYSLGVGDVQFNEADFRNFSNGIGKALITKGYLKGTIKDRQYSIFGRGVLVNLMLTEKGHKFFHKSNNPNEFFIKIGHRELKEIKNMLTLTKVSGTDAGKVKMVEYTTVYKFDGPEDIKKALEKTLEPNEIKVNTRSIPIAKYDDGWKILDTKAMAESRAKEALENL